MSGYMEEYLRWRQAEKLAPQLKAELEAIADNPQGDRRTVLYRA